MRRVFAVALSALMLIPLSPTWAAVDAGEQGWTEPPAGPAAGLLGEPTALVAHWRLDEGSGSTAADSSASGLTGIVAGPAWATGRFETGLAFTTWNQRVSVPRSSILEPATVTVAAWVRAATSPGPWANLVQKGQNGCVTASYMLYTGSTGGLQFVIGHNGGTEYVLSPTAPASVWDGQWHLAVGTHDGTYTRLYVDGVEVGSGTSWGSVEISYGLPTTNDLLIANGPQLCGASAFAGSIDDIRIWGRALSATEIAALTPPFGTTTTLVSSPNPTAPGASTSLTATVNPATATGTVTFSDVTDGGSTVLGTASLAGGTASISASFATPGDRQLVARYEGATDYAPSTSSPLVQQVSGEPLTPTTTTLVITPNPVSAGSPATFSATVAPVPTLGSVEWLIDGSPVGTTPVGVDGTASTSRTYADPGSHTVQARFVEGTLYESSQSAAVTLTVAPVGYLVTLTADPTAVVADATTHLVATVAPASGGTVAFYRGTVLLATKELVAGSEVALDAPVPFGASTFRADFTPEGASAVAASATTTVWGKHPSSLSLSADRSVAYAGETLVTLTASPNGVWGIDPTGTVTFEDVSGPTPITLGTATIAWSEGDWGSLEAVLQLRLTATGVRSIRATYMGDSAYLPSVSNVVAITVSPDTAVRASGVGVSHSTFYPYKDGYRDTVSIRGTPGERVSVLIRVYNSAGRVVRSWSLATRSSKWEIAWNGRSSAGTRQPAGKYKVTQRLRDAKGNTKTYTAYTTISNKRLYWYSGSITKYADTGRFDWTGDAGAYYSNRYRGIVLVGGSCYGESDIDEEYCDAAIGMHRFTLPSATSYSSIRLRVLGRSISGWGVGISGIWNYNSEEVDVPRSIGYSWTWYSTSSVGRTGHVSSSRVVTGVVGVTGANLGAVEYQKVQLTYRYALLR